MGRIFRRGHSGHYCCRGCDVRCFSLIGCDIGVRARMTVAQKLLKNHKLKPIETLYCTSPVCLLWMVRTVKSRASSM